MEAIVLAGGLGTRLAARLDGIPKPMAPVAGRPFLEIVLGQLKKAGYVRVVLSVGHLHPVIESHFGAVYRGLNVDYAIEQQPLGTGGAIRRALGRTVEDDVLVLNGDTFLEVDYKAMAATQTAQGTALTMAVTWREDVGRYGGVRLEGDRVAGFEEKGRTGAGWINAGSYIVRRDLRWPAGLPEKFSFERDFLMLEIARLRPAAFRSEGIFLDVGVPEDLDRAQTALAEFAV